MRHNFLTERISNGIKNLLGNEKEIVVVGGGIRTPDLPGFKRDAQPLSFTPYSLKNQGDYFQMK